MATYIEKLQEPKTLQKLESLIGGHIMNVYQSAGFTPPMPILVENRFVYLDSAPEKYAKHLREGMKLFALALDEIAEKNGGNDA